MAVEPASPRALDDHAIEALRRPPVPIMGAGQRQHMPGMDEQREAIHQHVRSARAKGRQCQQLIEARLLALQDIHHGAVDLRLQRQLADRPRDREHHPVARHGRREAQPRQQASMLAGRQLGAPTPEQVAPEAPVGRKIAHGLAQHGVADLPDERHDALRGRVAVEVVQERRGTRIGEVGRRQQRRHVGKLRQLGMLSQVFVRQIDAVHAEHGAKMMRRDRVDGEIARIGLPQLGDQIERERELLLRAAGIAALDLAHEVADRRQRRPARHAIVGDIDQAVGPQPPPEDRDHRLLAGAADPAQNAVQHDDVDVIVAALRRRGLEACFRNHEIGKAGLGDQAAGVRHMGAADVATFEGHIRVCGREQRQAKTLAEAELEHPPRPQRQARRASGAQGRESHVARRGLRIEAGRVADVSDGVAG